MGWSSQHLPLVWASAAGAVSLAFVAFERPQTLSARAYAAQLRGRFRAVQAEFERAVEAALRDHNITEVDAAALEAPCAEPERLDGADAADNTRR